MTDAASRRLLFLLPFAPRLDGMHGGSRTIGQLLSALAQRHRLAVLHLRGPGEPPVDDLLRSRCELIEEVERGGGAGFGRLRQRLSVVGSRLRGRPGWVAKWAVPAFESLV
ncbi:MAG: hypothetical protein M3Y40_02620, partial [Chloroflexota bacterium]|nr:hypothetical protein [Chloroflexota bacterium]